MTADPGCFMAYFRALLKIWQSPIVARIYSRHPVMYSQDQVCDSNHAECVSFSQSLVPRRNTKAYFLQHNAGCYRLYNNPRFPVRLQSIKVMISQMLLNYQRSRFTWRNCGCGRSLCRCSLLPGSPFGGVARSHARAERKRRRKCEGRGKRGRIFFLARYRSFPNFC